MNTPSTLRFLHASLALLACPAAIWAHDPLEITLEIHQRRNHFEIRLEMARSTAVAACDPEPSEGTLFEPSEFPQWKARFLEAAPKLIQLMDTEGSLEIRKIDASLTREDDVRLDYQLVGSNDAKLALHTPILSRFPPQGFGARVTFRDKSGRWSPPFMIFADSPSSPLPPDR